jgi:hypothetical protein
VLSISSIFIACVIAFTQKQFVVSGNELIADDSPIDLGTFHEGEIRTGKFTLKNKSKHAISILKVGTSCGCTRWTIDKYQIEPHETAQIQLEFNSSGKSGEEDILGMVSYKVSGFKQHYPLILVMHANVIPDYEYSPQTIHFDVNLKSEQEQIVEFRPVGVEFIELKDYKLIKSFLSVETVSDFEGSDKKKRYLKVRFFPNQYDPDLGNGELFANLITNTKKESDVLIPVVMIQKGHP